MSATHHEAHPEGHAKVHVVPLRVLLLVWGALMVLTWLTVSVTFIDLGNLNIVIALAIAVVKSSLVVLYFMHLRYDNPFNAFIFMSSVVFVMLFIGFALIDRSEYAPELIPGYEPAMVDAETARAAKAGEATAPPATSTPTPAAQADSAAGAPPTSTPAVHADTAAGAPPPSTPAAQADTAAAAPH